VTAIEVIGQIKALPPEERAKVVDFVREIEEARPEGTIAQQVFEQSAKQVFEVHDELMKKLSQ
jgi:hypothetical protein